MEDTVRRLYWRTFLDKTLGGFVHVEPIKDHVVRYMSNGWSDDEIRYLFVTNGAGRLLLSKVVAAKLGCSIGLINSMRSNVRTGKRKAPPDLVIPPKYVPQSKPKKVRKVKLVAPKPTLLPEPVEVKSEPAPPRVVVYVPEIPSSKTVRDVLVVNDSFIKPPTLQQRMARR